MKNFLILYLCLMTVFAQAYPKVVSWRNNPLVVFENDNKAVLKKAQEIKSPFFALTSRLDELSLILNSGNELELFKNSKIQVYEVFEDVNQEHILFLVDGTIRLRNSKGKPNRIRTPFFDLDQPADSDIMIQLNMKEPSVEIRVVRGEWNIEFFSYEKKVELRSGQQVKFIGELATESDQIKYDFLMNEKKIPKGKLEEIRKFEIAQFIEAKKNADADILQKEKEVERKAKRILAKKKIRAASFLCKNPFAQLNQCTWKLENDQCFRQRCNAGGQWGDKTERPVTAICTAAFLTGACDY